jgi:endonuclease IV
MPYLPNLASPDDELYEKSTAALVDAVKRTSRLGGRYLPRPYAAPSMPRLEPT